MRARENPFRTERLLTVRYRLQGTTWPKLLARWETLNRRTALVGPHGSGKTTLLEDLEPKLRERGFNTYWIRLNEDHRLFQPLILRIPLAQLTSGDVVLFDGAEQLNWMRWHWFRWRTRRVRGLIVTTHQPGRLPILWECRTSAHLLTDIIDELLGSDQGQFPRQAEPLFRRHRGNLREALRECYDRVAQTA